MLFLAPSCPLPSPPGRAATTTSGTMLKRSWAVRRRPRSCGCGTLCWRGRMAARYAPIPNEILARPRCSRGRSIRRRSNRPAPAWAAATAGALSRATKPRQPRSVCSTIPRRGDCSCGDTNCAMCVYVCSWVSPQLRREETSLRPPSLRVSSAGRASGQVGALENWRASVASLRSLGHWVSRFVCVRVGCHELADAEKSGVRAGWHTVSSTTSLIRASKFSRPETRRVAQVEIVLFHVCRRTGIPFQ